MCHFLTISVAGGAVPEVPEEFRRKVHFVEQRNRSVTRYSPSNWVSFTATSGGCSCDFYRAAEASPEDRTKLEQKYRKKGWSESKISRALENKTALIQTAGLRDDILGLVTVLINTHGATRLSLHWYSGDVETEDFTLNNVGSVSLADFRCDKSALREETTIMIAGDTVAH